ncbi:MAG: Wzz/FepE/Etk N-terminal domain-containing protein [Desulfuromonadaceae bacterium]|nr:Wzz/FepE/Etk N-terminal domain-containing protein [Desulfuromonadaceae bacterium]
MPHTEDKNLEPGASNLEPEFKPGTPDLEPEVKPQTPNLDPEVKPRASNPAPEVSNLGPEDPDVINLLDYLEVLAKNWRMIFKTTVVAAIISVGYSLCLPNIYSATARFLPPQQDSSGLMGMLMGAAGGMGGVAADLLGKGTPADMYVGILNSEAISDKIIDRFKLMDLYEQDYRVETYKKLDKNVDIVAGKKDGIISISVEDKDPKLAAAIANAYVEELGKLLSKLNITGAGQNRVYLEERLAKAKGDLVKAEEGLKQFQSKNKALDITEQSKGTIKGVADLEGQLAAEEVKLAGIKRVFTSSSQEVKNQLSVITNIKNQIAKFEGNRSSSSIPGIGSVPELGQQYVRLLREFKIQETIVEMLTKQYEMAKLSEAKDTTAIQVIQTAREPDKKAKPKRSLIVLATTFAAGFGAVIYAFMQEAGARMPEEDCAQWNRIKGLLPDVSRVFYRKKA